MSVLRPCHCSGGVCVRVRPEGPFFYGLAVNELLIKTFMDTEAFTPLLFVSYRAHYGSKYDPRMYTMCTTTVYSELLTSLKHN